MARPTLISNAQILDAARAVFLESGPTASTAAIARRAGISEGSIFKRFPTKEQLLIAAMGLPELHLDLDERVGRGDVRENLVEVALSIAEFFRELLPRVMSLWSQHKAHPQEMCKDRPRKVLTTLTAYFEAEMRCGRLRVSDPEVAARMLIGPLHNFAFFELMGVYAREKMEPSQFVRSLVDTLWMGLAPSEDQEEA